VITPVHAFYLQRNAIGGSLPYNPTKRGSQRFAMEKLQSGRRRCGMFHRFAAASAVASVVVAAAAVTTLVPPRWSAANALVLTTAWCFFPLAWGLWAMLAPLRWVDRRLPLWGAILGGVAGIIAGPVLDLPLRLAGLRGVRWMTLVVGPIFYYFLWLLVRVAYCSLRVPVQASDAASGSTRQ
jgi:hypothetical protein